MHDGKQKSFSNVVFAKISSRVVVDKKTLEHPLELPFQAMKVWKQRDKLNSQPCEQQGVTSEDWPPPRYPWNPVTKDKGTHMECQDREQ